MTRKPAAPIVVLGLRPDEAGRYATHLHHAVHLPQTLALDL